MPVERAKAMCDVAQTIINSAKVECQFMEATGVEPRGQFFETVELDAKRILPPRSNGRTV
jgi:hypothetical protein